MYLPLKRNIQLDGIANFITNSYKSTISAESKKQLNI